MTNLQGTSPRVAGLVQAGSVDRAAGRSEVAAWHTGNYCVTALPTACFGGDG